MEYPPWGLVSCWGRKLLRAKVPPPDTGVGGGEEKLRFSGVSWGFPRLRLGAGLLPQSPKLGLLQLGVRVCVSSEGPWRPGRKE